MQKGRGGRAGISCRSPPFPQAEIIHKELPEFIYWLSHEVFSRNPVLLKKKYKELLLLCAKEIFIIANAPIIETTWNRHHNLSKTTIAHKKYLPPFLYLRWPVRASKTHLRFALS